jgi:hypothetical protein
VIADVVLTPEASGFIEAIGRVLMLGATIAVWFWTRADKARAVAMDALQALKFGELQRHLDDVATRVERTAEKKYVDDIALRLDRYADKQVVSDIVAKLDKANERASALASSVNGMPERLRATFVAVEVGTARYEELSRRVDTLEKGRRDDRRT